jgi:hypothetical protein
LVTRCRNERCFTTRAAAYNDCLGIAAVGAEDIFLDELVEELLQAHCSVLAVDNEALVLRVNGRGRAQLNAKKLVDVYRVSAMHGDAQAHTAGRSRKGLGDIGHIDNDGLDAVALTFDLVKGISRRSHTLRQTHFGDQGGHLVPIV